MLDAYQMWQVQPLLYRAYPSTELRVHWCFLTTNIPRTGKAFHTIRYKLMSIANLLISIECSS